MAENFLMRGTKEFYVVIVADSIDLAAAHAATIVKSDLGMKLLSVSPVPGIVLASPAPTPEPSITDPKEQAPKLKQGRSRKSEVEALPQAA